MDNPKYMLSRDGKLRGNVINPCYRRCTMEGCSGWRILVQWPDGKRTYPCSCGCKTVNEQTVQIL